MAKPNKAKAHHSFLRNDALRCNVPYIQKTGKRGKKILHAIPLMATIILLKSTK